MPTKQQELQSLLLRLAVLVATSLSTISQPISPNIADDGQAECSSTAASLLQEKNDKLRAQILNDTRQLLQTVRKACTYLTLALRPEGSAAQGENNGVKGNESSSSISPTMGLRDASLDAAIAQLSTIMNDAVPKLVFLSRKASTGATLQRYTDLTEEQGRQRDAEEALIKAKGGHVVLSEHARPGKKLVKIPNGGLGQVWSRGLGEVIFVLLQALGSLSETYMDERTRLVLQKASKARDAADGIVGSTDGSPASVKMPESVEAARQQALQATAIVWEVCEAALGVKSGSSKLLLDNKKAVQSSWRRRTEVLQDTLRELNEGIESETQGEELEEDGEEDDPFAGLGTLTLPKEEIEQGRRFLMLLKAGCRLHARIGDLVLTGKGEQTNDIDLDDLDAAGDAFEKAVCEVTSAVLYSDTLPGVANNDGDTNGSASDDEDEDEDDNEVADALAVFMETVKALQAASRGAASNDNGDGEGDGRFDAQMREINDSYTSLNLDTSKKLTS